MTDLRRRLESIRWPSPPTRPAWADGVDPGLVRDLAAYWRAGFDWRARERALNRHRHIRADVDGLALHAMIAEPDSPAATPPLLALHGWPATFEQMTRLADRLIAPPHAMTVVAPSLPGFGFSGAPAEPGWDTARIARAVHTLMTEHLGHPRYLVRGTDYGLSVALHLGAMFPGHVTGVHIGGTHLAVPDDEGLPADLSAEERAFVETSRRWYADEGGYIDIQATKPETLAFSLSDSPAGLLAWIVEKYRTWCGTPDDLHAGFTPDDLLSTVTIYWATNTVASSVRLYREDHLGAAPAPARVPVAVNQPEAEEYRAPRSWWQRLQPRLTRYTLLPGAGHFPEWEAPDALVADLTEFAGSLRR